MTGHSGKVTSAKFLNEAKAVTGSFDRTLKVWDLRTHACLETKFAASCCNDMVTTDGAGTTIISAHYDRKVRFWDLRTDSIPVTVELEGKVTSLDLSKDGHYLLCCVRDHTIQMLDLRNHNQAVRSFTHVDFKVASDSTRVAFSYDTSSVAAGSADGSVYVWNVNGEVVSVLKEHKSPVSAVSWHPFSSVLASVDQSRKCVIWTD